MNNVRRDENAPDPAVVEEELGRLTVPYILWALLSVLGIVIGIPLEQAMSRAAAGVQVARNASYVAIPFDFNSTVWMDVPDDGRWASVLNGSANYTG